MTASATEMLKLDFITPEAEAALLKEIEAAMKAVPENGFPGYQGRSRVLRFGFGYDAGEKWLGHMPNWLGDAFKSKRLDELALHDSVTINEYRSGDSISPHVDSNDFGDPIQILSLASPAIMDFKRKCCAKPFSLILPPRSLLTLAGDYRYNWQHSVRPVAALRYSVVFRKRIIK